MASFVKFQQFAYDLATKVHNLNTDTLNVYLSNDAPVVATDQTKANVTEIGTGNGYTGPVDTQNSGAGSAGKDEVMCSPYITLTDATTITATRVAPTGGGGTTVVSFCVIEFS